MQEEVYFDKGSKRRIRRIRWKRSEILSAIALSIGAIALILTVAVWLITHSLD